MRRMEEVHLRLVMPTTASLRPTTNLQRWISPARVSDPPSGSHISRGCSLEVPVSPWAWPPEVYAPDVGDYSAARRTQSGSPKACPGTWAGDWGCWMTDPAAWAQVGHGQGWFPGKARNFGLGLKPPSAEAHRKPLMPDSKESCWINLGCWEVART